MPTLRSRAALVVCAIAAIFVFAVLVPSAAVTAIAYWTGVTPTGNVDEPGRTPWQWHTDLTCGPTLCTGQSPAVPAGMRLVVRNIAGVADAPASTNPMVLLFSGVTSGAPPWTTAVTTPPFTSNADLGANDWVGFSQAALFYQDSGHINVVAHGQNSGAVSVTISGYLVNCKLPCGPIVPSVQPAPHAAAVQ